MPLVAQSPGVHVCHVAKPANADMARQMQEAALLKRQQMSPHARPKDPLKLGSAHGDTVIGSPNSLGKPDAWAEKTNGVMHNLFHPGSEHERGSKGKESRVKFRMINQKWCVCVCVCVCVTHTYIYIHS